MHERYYVELAKQEKLLSRKNEKSDFYNGVFDRYVNPVLTRDMIPLTWRYDLNEETNPFFMERLGINAVMNSGAIYLNGKYYLVARIEGNDRKSFFGVAESDNGIDNFRFWDYPILLDDVCPEETNVYDMRLTQHEDGYIYGVFCSESKDTSVNDLSAAVAAAGIVRTKDLKHWERLENLKTLRSPQQRNVVLHPEFVDGKYNLSTVVTHKTSDWSVIELDKKISYVWIKAVRRIDAVEVFYSFDDKTYTMMRNAYLKDNTPVMVGLMAASPDGNGFEAKFENFKVTHLPDQRRLKWLENNK